MRALRRGHKRRMQRKALKIYGKTGMDPDFARRLADHLKVCSCALCGNPRRLGKGKERFTLQERRFPRGSIED